MRACHLPAIVASGGRGYFDDVVQRGFYKPSNPTTPEGWVKIADRELEDLKAALKGGASAVAVYHHAGMAVEAMLKAVLWKQHKWIVWPARAAAQHLYQHNLGEMMGATGWADELEKNPRLLISWQTVRLWQQQPRYCDGEMPQAVALAMALSVRHPDYGVLPWLRSRFQNIP